MKMDQEQTYEGKGVAIKRKLVGRLSDRIRSELTWYLHPAAVQSRRRFGEFYNRHQGGECVIVGNGPSIKNMDLSWLKDKYTFGLNRIYLLFPELGFPTTYFVSVNKLVIEQCVEDIRRLEMPKFISWYGRDLLNYSSSTYFIRDRRDRSFSFAKDPRYQIWEGATVTYVAMQLAYFMGFRRVYLIGVDHNFKTKGEPHKIITTQERDRDHFSTNYFGKGFRWQLPDLITSEKAYMLARKTFQEDGREILDATVDGKLDIFPKIDYRMIVN